MSINWVRKIEALIRNGQVDQAEAMVRQVKGTARGRAYLALAQSTISYFANNYDDSLAAAKQAQNAFRASGDKLGEGTALLTQANALRFMDNYKESLSAATEALAVFRAAKDKVGEGNALVSKAGNLGMRGDYEESLSAATEALAAFRAAKDKLGEGKALARQADALRMVGKYNESLSAAANALAASRAAKDKLCEGNALLSQASTLGVMDKYEESLSAATEALAAFRAATDKLGEGNALRSQASALLMMGRYEESLSAATKALAASHAAKYRAGEGNALACQVHALRELGKREEWEKALERLQSSAPEMAVRLRAMPVRPGWYPMVEGILRDKVKSEADLREVLHKAAAPPGLAKGALGKFQVLRNWASYTSVELMRPLNSSEGPSTRRTGGGYFLWWKGWGLVIDPGLGFGEAFRAAGWLPKNIHAVAATHHHIDHTGDMLPIVTTVFEMNDNRPPSSPDQQVDFLLAPGAFSAFSDVVAYVPGVRSVQLLRAGEVAEPAVPQGVSVEVTAVKAKHRDLTGRDDAAIGLRLDLSANKGRARCSVGLTSDTRYLEEAAQSFYNVDLMVVHIGSVYDSDIGKEEKKSWHLGFAGCVQMLQAIKRGSKPGWDPLVLVSEWGEELAPHRTVICEEMAKSARIRRVFPAEWKQSVALLASRAEPMCARNDGELANHWCVQAGGQIDYQCPKHDHGHPSAAPDRENGDLGSKGEGGHGLQPQKGSRGGPKANPRDKLKRLRKP